MTGRTDEPPLVLPSRSASRLLPALARSKWVWGTLVIILIATVLLPTMAKIPVALVAAGGLLFPVLRDVHDPAAVAAVDPQRWRDPNQAVRFDGRLGRAGSRNRWQQVRCVIRGSDLLMASYWRRSRPPRVISIRSSRVTSVTTSDIRDGLKPGLVRIINLQLADGSTLRLAVDLALSEAVQGALAAHA